MYMSVTNPQLAHNSPASKLKFQLGATAGYKAVNGYFYYVDFKWDQTAYLGTEIEVKAKRNSMNPPMFFWHTPSVHEVQYERKQYSKWDTEY